MVDISSVPENYCTGCGVCANVCRREAIVMRPNKEGFLYPFINKERCNSCGMCAKVCCAGDESSSIEPIKIFQAQAKDVERRKNSSSGGIIRLISDEVLQHDGVVFGVAFIGEKKEAHHVSTDDYPLSRLLRSKYVQSYTGNVYKTTQEELEKKRNVFFVGTPCHVEALKSYLKKSYDNLLTADFFCHGVPSGEFYKDYIKYVEKLFGKKTIDATFREKEFGWRNWRETFYFVDGSVQNIKREDSVFYSSFLSNCSLRRSCYHCMRYKAHMSDLTVADAWRVKDDDDTGVSVVFINTPKGLEWYKKIKDSLNEKELETGSFDIEFYKHNYETKSRRLFFREYLKYGFEDGLERYFSIIRKAKKRAIFRAKIKRIKEIIFTLKRRYI